MFINGFPSDQRNWTDPSVIPITGWGDFQHGLGSHLREESLVGRVAAHHLG
jgi:hypothetical protein